MLIWKNWRKQRNLYEGWFLFGVIPLLVRRLDVDVPRIKDM